MQLVLLMGIQAAGKSTFYREQFGDTHLRINLDMLRKRHKEAIIFYAALAAAQRCCIDNTNTQLWQRKRYIEPAQESGFEIVGYYFDVPLADAIRRNSERAGKACIPPKAIERFYNELVVPTYREGFDKLYRIKVGEGTFEIEDM